MELLRQETRKVDQLLVTSSTSISKIPRNRIAYLESVLGGHLPGISTVSRISGMRSVKETSEFDDNGAVPIRASDEPPPPPTQPPPTSTEENDSKSSSFASTPLTGRSMHQRHYTSLMTTPIQIPVGEFSRENSKFEEVEVSKDYDAATLPKPTDEPSAELPSAEEDKCTPSSVHHSTPKPNYCGVYPSTVNSIPFSGISIVACSTLSATPVAKLSRGQAEEVLLVGRGRTEVVESPLSTPSTDGSGTRRTEEPTWNADRNEPSGMTAAAAARPRRDHQQMRKDEQAYGVGVVGGDSRDGGEEGHHSLCEDRRTLHRRVDACGRRRCDEAERCAEANATGREAAAVTATTESLEDHNGRRAIRSPLKQSTLQPHIAAMGACSSKKPLQPGQRNCPAGSKTVGYARPTANDGVLKTVKGSGTAEQLQQEQQQQQGQQQQQQQQQPKKILTMQKPIKLLEDGDDDIAELEPSPLARKLKLKRDSIAVTKVRMNRTQQEKGAMTIEEEEDAEEFVPDAIVEQNTDRVHFNISNTPDGSDGNLSLPNDSGLSLNSNYSAAAASDPGSFGECSSLSARMWSLSSDVTSASTLRENVTLRSARKPPVYSRRMPGFLSIKERTQQLLKNLPKEEKVVPLHFRHVDL